MNRVTRRSWTPEEIDILFSLVEKGVSPARASVILKRPTLAVQSKARVLGKPFRHMRQLRAARLDRELTEMETIKRRDAKNSDSITEAKSGRTISSDRGLPG